MGILRGNQAAVVVQPVALRKLHRISRMQIHEIQLAFPLRLCTV